MSVFVGVMSDLMYWYLTSAAAAERSLAWQVEARKLGVLGADSGPVILCVQHFDDIQGLWSP